MTNCKFIGLVGKKQQNTHLIVVHLNKIQKYEV